MTDHQKTALPKKSVSDYLMQKHVSLQLDVATKELLIIKQQQSVQTGWLIMLSATILALVMLLALIALRLA